jgi:photosystem II stability/assembly factor-like uncharacterized protein
MAAALAAAMLILGACGSRVPSAAVTASAAASATATAAPTTASVGAASMRVTQTATMTLHRVAPPASSAPAAGIRDVAFRDGQHGLLVTGGILVGTTTGTAVSGTGRVQITSDGGRSWTTVWQSAGAVLDWVGFADAQHAFAAGRTFPSANAAGTPLVLVSADGGHSWQAVHPSLPGPAAAAWSGLRFDFVTPMVGYAVTDPDFSMGPGEVSGVLRTTDGGRTWTMAQLPGATATGGLAFVSATTGYVTGSSQACFGGVWESTDGGSTWGLLPASCSRGYRLHALDFVDASTGFAAGGRNQKWGNPPWQAVMVTRDGGRTWQVVYTDSAQHDPFGDAITRLHFADAQHGWAATGGCVMGQNTPCAGEVLVTSDGGETWRSAAQSATHLATVGTTQAWAVPAMAAGSGLLWTTADGGATWQPLGRAEASNFGVVRTSGSSVLLAGAVGFLLSRDGGQTWQRLAGSPTTDDAIAAGLIAALDPSGQGLEISRDSGATWTDVPIATAQQMAISSFALTPSGDGLAATYGSTCINPAKGGRVQPSQLLASSDAGRSWQPLPQASLAITDLAEGPGLAAALGERDCAQVVGLSRDGGRSWQSQPLPKGLICGDVSVAAPNTVWIACSSTSASYTTDATLLLSEDAGATWTQLSATGTDVTSLAADTPTSGWMTAAGALWRTGDGGRTWTEIWPATH